MDKHRSGWLNGFLGVLIFSGSLPATRVAVLEFDPLFLTVVRAAIAGIAGLGLVLAFRSPWPDRKDFGPLVIVAFGVVIGFPLLTALALKHITSAHSVVFIGLLPLATAIFGVVRGGERPLPPFWIFSCLGSAFVVAFMLSKSGLTLSIGDGLMIAAVLLCGLGYAEGGVLSRHLGGWQVISWALLISLPLMLLLSWLTMPDNFTSISAPAWFSLSYVSLFSMLFGFVFWYRGLAQGGIAGVGQLQLLQPFLSLIWAALLLNESVHPAMLLTTVAVVACVAGARRYARASVSAGGQPLPTK